MSWVFLYFSIYLGLHLFLDRWAERSLRASQKIKPAQEKLPPVTFIKPVKGADRFTEENFRSWLTQGYESEVQFIFSFQDLHDPALEILKKLEGIRPFEVVIHPVREGFSGKMSNLYYGIQHARHELLVLSDADTFAPPETLKRITRVMLDGADLAGCFPQYQEGDNVWGKLYVLLWNTVLFYFWAPSVLVKRSTGMAGPTFAIWKEALEKIGGVEAFKNYLAEDLEMGRAARKRGLSIRLGPLIQAPVAKLSLRDLADKLRRANLINLTMRPYGRLVAYLFYPFAFGYLPILIYGLVAARLDLLLLCLFLYVGRGFFMGRLFSLATGRFRFPYDYPLLDLLILGILPLVLLKPELEWAGVRYRVSKLGTLTRL